MSEPSHFALTARQQRLYDFIAASIEETGRGPTFEAMASHMNLKAKSNISRMVAALEERGRIRRIPHRACAIALASPLANIPAYELMAELRSRGIEVKVVTA